MVSMSVGVSSMGWGLVWCRYVGLWEVTIVVASSRCASILLIAGKAVLERCLLVYVFPIMARC